MSQFDPNIIDAAVSEAIPVVGDEPPQQTTALAKKEETKVPIPIADGKITPTEFGQLGRLAICMQRAATLPKGYDKLTPEQQIGRAIIAMGYGMPLGLTPFQAVRSIAVVNNVPSIWGDDVPGLVYASGKIDGVFEEGWDDLEKDGTAGEKTVAWCRAKRKGSDKIIERRFGAADAKSAQLWNKTGPWSAGYRKRMLQLRARGWLCRDLFPDVLGGLMMAEEAQDIPAPASDADKINARIDALQQPE